MVIFYKYFLYIKLCIELFYFNYRLSNGFYNERNLVARVTNNVRSPFLYHYAALSSI